jgi:hypothetical protein
LKAFETLIGKQVTILIVEKRRKNYDE